VRVIDVIVLGLLIGGAWLIVRRRVSAWRVRQIVKRIFHLPD